MGNCCRGFLWEVNNSNSGKIGISKKLRGAGVRVGKWELRGAGRENRRWKGAFAKLPQEKQVETSTFSSDEFNFSSLPL